VIELPPALAPWAAQLAVLPAELALALAPWVGRLAVAMGRLSPVRSRRAGDPDGYSGLARRGSYERLVITEWGVAELFPDEFLRRATAGEHLFLDLARREPRGALRSVAIVSAGPGQLGAPRLAHLAALIVLARRATAAGAGFSWGVLEDTGHQLTDGFDEAAVARLLDARTAVAAEPGAIAAWLTAIGGDPACDAWLIGDPDAARAARRAGAATAIVRDVLEPSARAIEVEIEHRGPAARVRLELPAPALCARMLRDPYAGVRGSSGAPRSAPWPARAVTAAGPARSVRFAPGGRRLLVELAGGAVESWPIPGSPREPVGRPRRWTPPPDHTTVALGTWRRTPLAATATRRDPGTLALGTGDGRRVTVRLPDRVAAALEARLAAGTAMPIGACAFVRLRASGPELVLEIAGHLVFIHDELEVWPPPGTTLVAHPLNVSAARSPPTVLATVFHETGIVWAERRDDATTCIVEATSSGNRTIARLETSSAPQVYFGFVSPPRRGSWVVAVSSGDDWIVTAPQLAPATVRYHVPHPVAGVCLRDGVPALLARLHRWRLLWVHGDRREVIQPGAAPIAAVAVCPRRPHVAWITDGGEVTVYSVERNAVLLRRQCEDAP
jgi:hypothetical protein